jgi:hypothetical protein
MIIALEKLPDRRNEIGLLMGKRDIAKDRLKAEGYAVPLENDDARR